MQSDRKYLYSFTGCHNNTYRSDIRKRIFKLNNNKSLIKSNNEWFFNKNVYGSETINVDEQYKKILSESEFVLCPSGTGSNSIRFYETMSYSSTPVLFADDILLPPYIDWDKYIVKIDENDVDNIDKYLIKKEDMLSLFNKYFHPDSVLNQIIETYNTNSTYDDTISDHLLNKVKFKNIPWAQDQLNVFIDDKTIVFNNLPDCAMKFIKLIFHKNVIFNFNNYDENLDYRIKLGLCICEMNKTNKYIFIVKNISKYEEIFKLFGCYYISDQIYNGTIYNYEEDALINYFNIDIPTKSVQIDTHNFCYDRIC
jgi:hypothetical protein